MKDIKLLIALKNISAAGLIFFNTACSGQSQPNVINNNLDNFVVNSSYEDMANFKGGNIYSAKIYKAKLKNGPVQNTKVIGGKPYIQDSYTEYLPDGRKKYRVKYYDQTQTTEKYHYDSKTGNLNLKELQQNANKTNRDWLVYDQDGVLKAQVKYYTLPRKPYVYEAFIQYLKVADGKHINVKITEYGADSVAGPTKIYDFALPQLSKSRPEYQSKLEKFELINGQFKPVLAKGYVFDDREVVSTYDKNGFLLSEIWYKPAGTLENRIEYTYGNNYKERIEQRYQRLGTEKSSRMVRKYDQHDNPIFEQMTEYTGNVLSPTHFTYVYDAKGNWTEKRTYYQLLENGVYGQRQLQAIEIREIIYQNPALKERIFTLPKMPGEFRNIETEMPKWASKRQKQVNQYNDALANGNYDEEIKTSQASNLKEFTPKLWKVIDIVYGDLDNIAGDEAVISYKTPIDGDMGKMQALAVFKKAKGKWELWYQTSSPLLSDQAGGMMGNPYAGISIERRAIVIQHFGGSRDKWNYRHRYRFQNNNWYLIGAEVNFGAPCDNFTKFDYNLSTGDAVVSYTEEHCNEKNTGKSTAWSEQFKIKPATLPLMNNFIPGESVIKTPKRKKEIYY
jgi:hypothetical protein